MKQSKKVYLFIVEGITDETSLGLILSRLVGSNKVVRFLIIGGDITTQKGVNPSNCLKRLGDRINSFLDENFYHKSDISEIIHLIDVDGTFVSSEKICFDPTKLEHECHILYTQECIFTDNVDKIQERNKIKSSILEKLRGTKTLCGGIPYHIYYFSCNLEHVLYNRQNLPDREKFMFAKEAEDEFVQCPHEFVVFMNSNEIAVDEDYETSWAILKEENQSLLRHSNFNIFLKQVTQK